MSNYHFTDQGSVEIQCPFLTEEQVRAVVAEMLAEHDRALNERVVEAINGTWSAFRAKNLS